MLRYRLKLTAFRPAQPATQILAWDTDSGEPSMNFGPICKTIIHEIIEATSAKAIARGLALAQAHFPRDAGWFDHSACVVEEISIPDESSSSTAESER